MSRNFKGTKSDRSQTKAMNRKFHELTKGYVNTLELTPEEFDEFEQEENMTSQYKDWDDWD